MRYESRSIVKPNEFLQPFTKLHHIWLTNGWTNKQTDCVT